MYVSGEPERSPRGGNAALKTGQRTVEPHARWFLDLREAGAVAVGGRGLLDVLVERQGEHEHGRSDLGEPADEDCPHEPPGRALRIVVLGHRLIVRDTLKDLAGAERVGDPAKSRETSSLVHLRPLRLGDLL